MRAATIVLGVGAMTLLAALLLSGCGKNEPEEATPAGVPATQETEPEVGAARPDEETPRIAQTVCPVMGGKINPDIYVDHNGRRVYFCCKACVEQFKEEPEKYLKKLDEGLVQ
jgi:YHS domain-containing protein